MKKFAVNGKLIAIRGKRDALTEYLLSAAQKMESLDTCYCYIVGVDPEDGDAVYIFEVWENEAAHQAALQMDVFQRLIDEARPLIAGMEDFPSLQILGGKASL